jgi:hypothetical protein
VVDGTVKFFHPTYKKFFTLEQLMEITKGTSNSTPNNPPTPRVISVGDSPVQITPRPPQRPVNVEQALQKNLP